jgi:hypothetical protein
MFKRDLPSPPLHTLSLAFPTTDFSSFIFFPNCTIRNLKLSLTLLFLWCLYLIGKKILLTVAKNLPEFKHFSLDPLLYLFPNNYHFIPGLSPWPSHLFTSFLASPTKNELQQQPEWSAKQKSNDTMPLLKTLK